jgi:autotransporter translocation and assembly factor TamB
MSVMRRSLQVVAFLCTLIVGVTSMAVIVTQTTWFKEWLRGFIVRQASDYVNGQLSIGRIDGNLFYGVRLADIGIAQNGKTVVGVDDVGVNYNVFTFIRGDVVLDDIRLTRPVVRLERDADGTLNLANLIKARTPKQPKSNRTIEIGEIGISDGTLYVEPGAVGTSGVDIPEKVERLDASIGVKSDADQLLLKIAHISLRGDDPAFGINSLSGVVRRTGDQLTLENVSLRTEESSLRVNGTVDRIGGDTPVLGLDVSSDKLALNEIAKILPALQGYAMQPALELKASGPMDRLEVTLNVRDAQAGKLTGMLVVDAVEPGRRVGGTVSLEHFNLAPLVPTKSGASAKKASATSSSSSLRSDITGEARIDLALPSGRLPLSGTYAVNAGRIVFAGYEARNVVARGRIDGETIRVDAKASAYGGRATVAGTVKTGPQVTLALQGRAEHLDLRNLPASLAVPAVPSDITTAYTLAGRGSVFSGTYSLDDSMLAGAKLAKGTSGSFAVGDGAPRYSAKGQVANLDLQLIGKDFAIAALATDRYRSTLNASFDVNGSGGGRYPLTIDATGTAVDSTLFGASFPMLDFTANVGGGDLHVKATGRFANLNPATVAENEKLAGMLNGDVDVETTLRAYADGVTADSIDLSGRITVAPSTFGDLSFDKVDVEGQYAHLEGNLTRLEVTGSDVNVTAQGAVALNETGSSNLTLHAESAALDEVGKIVGQPLKGAAQVDATVTGNAKALRAKGTLKGSDIGQGENEALSLTSNFDVTVPDLMPAQAIVTASNMATFLEIAGQKITELTADVTYQQSKLDFEARAQEGVRQLEAGGSVIFHPDHQEIVLPALALRSEMIEWRTPANVEPARVQYSKDRIAVEHLVLTNADQKIEADGVFGSNTEPLHVRAENVDVAQVDALFLGDQRIGGKFAADATITGPTSDPQVQGEFSLTQGTFQTYKFESLAGKVAYVKDGVDLDVKLQQSPTEWLEAKGSAPLTLFKATPPEMAGQHVAPTPGDTVNLEVASSQINLAAIQGFTSAVTNVTGVLQANIKVTGSGRDPHLDGAVDIRGGSFAIPDLGTKYTGLDTRIELNQDGLTIPEFKILDSRGFPMTIGGTLALHARAVGAVDIKAQSSKFEVIDNKILDLKLNTDIHLTGELRRPKVVGTIEVENGTVHVEELVSRFGADPYATQEAAINPQQPAGGQPGTPPQPSVFDALDMDVKLSIPSNLVLRGNGIEAPNAPVALGDVNITVGGMLDIQKPPSGKLRLDGDVTTVRGTYTFQGRRFDIVRDGRIGFSGAEDLDPLLDLQARREISGIETFVHVRGTMKRPQLSFSSNPPLEEADILSLIVFNQPINQLGEGQQVSLTQRAGALASGYLTSGLSRSIGNALDLDEFEIQAQGENGAGPSLTVGEQVGRNLFFRLRQAFGNETTTELILEYQIREYLRAQASVAEGNTTQRVQFRRVERAGLDLIFFFSY